jgi:hypothetical protein
MVGPGQCEYRCYADGQWLNEAKNLNDPKSEMRTWKEDQTNDALPIFQLSAAILVHFAAERQSTE